MTGIPEEDRPLNIRGLVGIGFDGEQGKTRITRGPNFYLHGGSQETHERMTETALKFNEKVDDRGKRIGQINARELKEIAGELREEI